MDIMDLPHLWIEDMDMDEDLLDDEGMDDMFTVDLADTSAIDALVRRELNCMLYQLLRVQHSCSSTQFWGSVLPSIVETRDQNFSGCPLLFTYRI